MTDDEREDFKAPILEKYEEKATLTTPPQDSGTMA